MTQDEACERLRVLLDRLPEDERRRFEALVGAERPGVETTRH